jgi:hypothetical protein
MKSARYLPLLVLCGLAFLGFALLGQRAPQAPKAPAPIDIPRTWDSTALADFVLPLPDTAVDVRHISEDYYYRLPTRTIYKGYPVYHPDYEPEGYLDSLRQFEPVDLFDPAQLKTEEDWIRAGELVFDTPHFLLSLDSPFGLDNLVAAGVPTTPEGIFPFNRYVITQNGELRLGQAACGNCHTRVMPDGSVIKGAQGNFNLDRVRVRAATRRNPPPEVVRALEREHFGAPWIDHPSQTQLDTLTLQGYLAAHAAIPDGVLLRQGTNHAYPARIPDLRGIRDHRYLDATGHMRNRGPGDLMRYAAFNANVDLLTRFDNFIPEFGEHEGPLPPPGTSIPPFPPGGFNRFTDAQLYALARYLYSLEPVPSPFTYDAATLARGEQVFIEEGCVTCHTPPLYTNNELTPALGFIPPEDHYERYDIFDISVETDPGLARYTRRGTGYYKVPSLRGLWYRTPLLHDGSLTTLEELLDPERLEADYEPSGFRGAGVEHRAVPGHPFGLELAEADKAALIAFMKTL